MRVLTERWGAVAALVLTTLAFSLVHGSNPNFAPLALVNIALAGLLLGLILLVTGSLWWAIGLHLGWNFATTYLADLPVSGLVIVDAPLVEVTQPGNPLLTGGEFGLEGGLAATAGLLVAVGFLAAPTLHRARYSRGFAPGPLTRNVEGVMTMDRVAVIGAGTMGQRHRACVCAGGPAGHPRRRGSRGPGARRRDHRPEHGSPGREGTDHRDRPRPGAGANRARGTRLRQPRAPTSSSRRSRKSPN